MDWGRKDRIAARAAEWVVLVDSERFDASAAARLKRWLARSPDHREAYRVSSQAWTGLDGLGQLKLYPEIAALLAAPDDGIAAQSEPPLLQRRALLAGAGAGALATGVVAYAAIGAASAESFETGVGERRDVTLEDGTTIALNADTRVEARLSAQGRQARVTRGEALFAIAENDAAAFAISAPGAAVEALRGEVLVKVLLHGVRISLISDAARARRRGFLGASAGVAVGARTELEFEGGELQVAQVDASHLAQRTLWREGRLVFDNTPLAEAAEDVSRQTGARFRFSDPALAALRVGGVIDARDLDGFLAMLRRNLAVEARRDEGGVLLLTAMTAPAP